MGGGLASALISREAAARKGPRQGDPSRALAFALVAAKKDVRPPALDEHRSVWRREEILVTERALAKLRQRRLACIAGQTFGLLLNDRMIGVHVVQPESRE